MNSAIVDFFSKDHRHCDQAFLLIGAALENENWPQALLYFQDFETLLNRHLEWEEAILFPAFEQKMGMTSGPTFMMKREHEQIRACIRGIKHSLELKDLEEFSGNSEALHILLQQHNMKEEQILYPMCDQYLNDQAVNLLAKMK